MGGRSLERKIEKYKRRLDRLQRKLSRSPSRSRSLLRNPSPDSRISDHSEIQECVYEDVVGPESITADLRDALGTEYEDNTKFEGEIQSDITKRWNHILTNGLTKEERENIMKKYKFPENCQLLAAPILNEEVKAVMTESSKQRDKSIEMTQQQLGLASAIIGQVMTKLIGKKEINNIELLALLADSSKLLTDINFQNTKTRRILISPLLDKNFNTIVEKVKRDENLYGTDLANKIKNSLDLKKSSSQIKKPIHKPPQKHTTKHRTSGNQYGPPQTQLGQQTVAAAPRGGPRNRATQPPPRQVSRSYTRTRPERAAPRRYKC